MKINVDLTSEEKLNKMEKILQNKIDDLKDAINYFNKLNEIKKIVDSYNERFCYVRYNLDELYERRDIIKHRLKYPPTSFYSKEANEERLARLNEAIPHFNERMCDISDKIDKLYEENKNIFE